jgi:hypothetical protein
VTFISRRWPAAGLSIVAVALAALAAGAAGGSGSWYTAVAAVPAIAALSTAMLGWRHGAALGAVLIGGGYAAGLLAGANGGSAPLVALACWLAAEAAARAATPDSGPFDRREAADLIGICIGSALLGVLWLSLGNRPLPRGIATEATGLAGTVMLVLVVWLAVRPRRGNSPDRHARSERD